MLMRYLGEAPGHSEWLQGRINLEEVAREILSKKKFLEFLALRRGDGSDEDVAEGEGRDRIGMD